MNLKIFLVLMSVAAIPMAAAFVCPTTVNTNTGCGYIITIGASGANPYDGGDDALIGVINNSGADYSESFTLIGSGNGGGLFAFDGDGICNYTHAAYCATAPTGYEGPSNTFSGITTTSVGDDTGTVNISGLAAGATTYFSLESAPTTIGSVVIMPGPTGTPEPGSICLLAGGFGLLAAARYRKQKRSKQS